MNGSVAAAALPDNSLFGIKQAFLQQASPEWRDLTRKTAPQLPHPEAVPAVAFSPPSRGPRAVCVELPSLDAQCELETRDTTMTDRGPALKEVDHEREDVAGPYPLHPPTPPAL